MTKSKISILLFLFITNTIQAQQQTIKDSLTAIINLQKNDTAEVNALAYLANEQTQFDSTIKYAQQGLLLAQKLTYKKGEADCLFVIGRSSVNLTQAIKYCLSALSIYEGIQNNTGIASSHLILQGSYREALDYRNALQHGIVGEQIAEKNNVMGVFVFTGHRLAPLFLAEIGQTYLLINKPDSALLYTQKSINHDELFNGAKWGFPFYLLATIQTLQQNYTPALQNFRSSILLSIQNGFSHDTLQIYSGMSTLFKKTGQLDSAVFYAQIVTRSGDNQTEPKNMAEALTNLAHAYKLSGSKDSALKYMELSRLSKYEPTVSVCTKKVDSKIEIHVKDNGIGIPQKVVDKIFQPFFTTKPTGQGTGLGLSLSYDIIKAHGGEIKVETKEDEGSEFIIQLPLKEND